MAKEKYYSIDNLMRKNATYSISIGERNSGKTYSSLEYGLKQYQKTGGKIAYIRRWKEDIIGKRGNNLFSGLVSNNLISEYTGGKFVDVKYWGGAFYLANYDDKGKKVFMDNDTICYSFALSDTEHNKSTEYSDITTIIFDEFIARGAYLPDEFILFMNTLSTIIRHKENVKIIMLGNTINKFCPYFKEMGLSHIYKMQEGNIDLYEYGNKKLKVAVEYTKSLDIKEKTNFYYAFNNPKLSVITNGKWELPIYPHCKVSFVGKDIIFKYYIEFEDKIFECDIVSKDDNFFTFIFEKTTPIKDKSDSLIYNLETNEKINYNSNILKPMNKTQERILYFFRNNKVFYSDNEVGNYIENFLRGCK